MEETVGGFCAMNTALVRAALGKNFTQEVLYVFQQSDQVGLEIGGLVTLPTASVSAPEGSCGVRNRPLGTTRRDGTTTPTSLHSQTT